MNPFTIHEVECRSIMNRSRIPGIDYTINPYTGCQHGCVYCYARFMTKFAKHPAEWERFVDVKTNAAEVLRKQLARSSRGLVSLSTVTDPYQPAERKYGLTRTILTQLAEHGFHVSVLTKSDLVLRDVDVLKRFHRKDCEVGFSIATLDEDVRRHFEPNAPPVTRRIQALKTLHGQGIRTWVFIAPVLLNITRDTLVDLLNEIRGAFDYLLVDKLNIKCGNWQTISKVLTIHYPHLLPTWKETLFSKEQKMRAYQDICRTILEFCDKNRLEVECC